MTLDIDKDVGICIMDKLMEYVENPTEDLLQFIVDTLIYFKAHIDIIVDPDTYRFSISRNSFFYVEPLDLSTYYVLEPLVDRYELRNRSALQKFLEV